MLIEKQAKPHDKVCGEFISYEAQHYISELGLNLQALGAVPINHMRLLHGRKKASAALPFQAMSLTRRLLDEALLTRARTAGATVQRGIAVTALEPEDTHWRLQLGNGEILQAEQVFLASGKHALRGYPRHMERSPAYIGFKQYFQLPPQPFLLNGEVEVILFEGGYAGLEPVEGGRLNLCLVVTKQHYTACGKDWSQLLAHIFLRTPLLAKRLEYAKPCSNEPLAIFGIPYGYVYQPGAAAQAGLFRIGDQMAVIPSFCGDGMAIAFHTAAQAVQYALTSNSAAYHAAMQAELQPQIKRAMQFSRLLETPVRQTISLTLLRFAPKLLEVATRLTRLRVFPLQN